MAHFIFPLNIEFLVLSVSRPGSKSSRLIAIDCNLMKLKIKFRAMAAKKKRQRPNLKNTANIGFEAQF
jgi:hypothetical protein